jgi:dTDP-4-amino-4,6-dideoxygalactose transaminase
MKSMSDRIELVDLNAMYRDLRPEIDAAIQGVLDRSAFIGGEPVRAFEAAFAEYTGAAHCIGVGNGTDALQLVLMAAKLPAGSEVIVPANTFIATAEAVVAAGLKPVFADVDPDSGLLDLTALPITAATSAVIPVHLYGRLVDMNAVNAIAAQHGLFVLEDAAQAHAARRDGQHSGTFGDAGCFSFYPGKNLGAFGDAGAVITNDPELAAGVALLRDHGRHSRDNHTVVGVNSRLDGIQAAVLATKLPHLDRWTEERRRVAETYRSLLDPALLDYVQRTDPATEAHHLFPILTANRDQLADTLREHGIMTAVHYRQTVPSAPAFGAVANAFPVAERRAATQLSLPIHPYLTEAQAEFIAQTVNTHIPAAV